MDKAILSALIPSAGSTARSHIGGVLKLFGEQVVSFITDAGVTIRPLRACERFDGASPALKRLGIDVDAWPAPPAGLFVVEERCVYLRSRSPMTIAHEVAHGLDCALGRGVYRSGSDPKIRAAFSGALAFITPYAATGIDEYFAECVRAYVEANDTLSSWPPATRERLNRIDPAMNDIVESIFDAI